MKTTKAISTISFNTEDFLKGKLNDLVDADILSTWVYIKHQPDEDSGKEHFHVYMVPSQSVDLTKLRKQFKEPDAEKPETPKGCLNIVKSEWVNWAWYGLHDWAYLQSKGERRNIHYKREDFVCNDADELQALLSTLKPTRDMLQWVVIQEALEKPNKDVIKILQENYITPFDWDKMTKAVELARHSKWLDDSRVRDENGFKKVKTKEDEIPFINVEKSKN